MPTLRKYRNHEGFYIKGYLHGVGFCTWQIGKEGLDYLANRGVRGDGDRITLHDLSFLRERDLIGPLGEGGTRSPDALLDPAGRDLRPLAKALSEWARQGGVELLGTILYGPRGDFRTTCFSTGFLRWLDSLELSRGLASLDEVSWPDFDDLVVDRVDRLPDPIHQHIALLGASPVLWQLARVVGRVARHREASDVCPAGWQAKHPVLHRLFADLGDLLKLPKPARLSPLPKGKLSIRMPQIWWEIDFQQVVAVLPAQRIEHGSTLTWQIPDVEVTSPVAWPDKDGVQIEETRSPPLDPKSQYSIQLILQPGNHTVTKDVWLCRETDACLLFALDGSFIAFEEAESLSPGEYLALVRADKADAILAKPGIEIAERIAPAPIGWSGWRGYRVCLSDGAKLESHSVSSRQGDVTWEPDQSPPASVLFANSFPVWIQGLPRLWVSDEAAFNGAVIEIVSERKAGDLRRLLRVGVDGDVHVRRDGDRPYLDLMGAKELKSVYGTLHLSCRLPAYPDQRPLNCSLVRCPNVDLDYVLDPVMPQLAQAVRVRCHDRVECGADSEVVLGDRGERIFRAQRPVDCPGVTCILPDSHVELRIRVPVTRVYPIGRQIRTDKWLCPPIQLELRAVELNDRLRVELHEEPELENGQLLCRLVGGGEVNAGIPTRTAHTYEINLHRWRDTLGFGVGGTVQVRGRTRWLEIAQLPAPPAVYERQSPPPISGRARLIQALEMAAQTGDLASVADLVTDCAAAIERGHVVDAELLPVALGRAYMAWGEYDKCESCLAGLCSREDLHEVRIVLAAVALRRGRDRNAVDLSNKRALLADTLIECPQKHLLFAEHYYHMATLLGGKSVGSWQTCEQEAGNARKMLGTGSPPWSVDYLDASLLQMLARLMLAQEPAPPLPDVPNRWRWLDVLSFVADHVRTAWVKKARKRKPPALPRSSPTILRRNELDLIRLGYFQAVGAATESASLLARFNGWTRDDFFAIRLLRARQARLEGRDEDARREYRHLVDEASSNGPDFLLDVAAEEQI